MSGHSGIEVYAVGFFRDVRTLRSRIRRRIPGAWRAFGYWFARSWRRRSYWNGYLAEWHYPPTGMNHTRCGRGWTKRGALRRLGIHHAESNLLP